MRIRPAGHADLPFLREMLARAASWRSEELDWRPLEDPAVSCYLDGFGSAGDTALIAEDELGRAIGAAWYRYFTVEEPGFGFVAPNVPELTIAVSPENRGQGVGTALVNALIDGAKRDGIEALSLSVEEDNPAMRLYERLGFEPTATRQNAITMRRDLGVTPPPHDVRTRR